MKKEYIKPSMRIVLLQHKNCLLVGSVGGYNGRFIERNDDTNNYIFEESDVW